MKFNISSQHMKYGRKALDKIMTPGYKRVGLLRNGLVYSLVVYILRHKVPIQIFAFDFTNRTREPTSNFISSYRYHQRHLKPIWEHFDLRKTQHCGSHWLLKLSFLLALQWEPRKGWYRKSDHVNVISRNGKIFIQSRHSNEYYKKGRASWSYRTDGLSTFE